MQRGAFGRKPRIRGLLMDVSNFCRTYFMPFSFATPKELPRSYVSLSLYFVYARWCFQTSPKDFRAFKDPSKPHQNTFGISVLTRLPPPSYSRSQSSFSYNKISLDSWWMGCLLDMLAFFSGLPNAFQITQNLLFSVLFIFSPFSTKILKLFTQNLLHFSLSPVKRTGSSVLFPVLFKSPKVCFPVLEYCIRWRNRSRNGILLGAGALKISAEKAPKELYFGCIQENVKWTQYALR